MTEIESDDLFDLAISEEQIANMIVEMKQAKYLLPKLAIEGQATVIAGAPNSGKTLLTLAFPKMAIEENEIEGSGIMYINPDDNGEGIVTKASYCYAYGIKCLSPHINRISPAEISSRIDYDIEIGKASGRTLIFDTVKKFVDVMDKGKRRIWFDLIRKWTTAGGSAILLTHTNKHKDRDGASIYSGTADILQDMDCLYNLEVVDDTDPNWRTVQFTLQKARGNNVPELAVKYLKTTDSWIDKAYSVQILDDQDAVRKVRAKASRDQYRHKNSHAVTDAYNWLASHPNANQSDFLENIVSLTGISKNSANRMIHTLCGVEEDQGYLWWWDRGHENNTKHYKCHPLRT